jgi:DNA-binding beta-propeller fold protein YncE
MLWHKAQGAGGLGVAVEGWNLSSASYDSVTVDLSSEFTNSRQLFFKPDGFKFFISGDGSLNRNIREYSLSTSWDLSTASSGNFYAPAEDPTAEGLFFKPDGSKLYFVGNNNTTIYQYSLSTAWEITSASYDSVSISVASQTTNPTGLFIKSDGTKLFLVDGNGDAILQYSFSTAWDLSTLSYDSVSFSVASQEAAPRGVYVKPDGLKFYVLGFGADDVFQYSMSSEWDLSTASYDSVLFAVNAQDSSAHSLSFKTDGTKMYIVGTSSDSIYQYTLTD